MINDIVEQFARQGRLKRNTAGGFIWRYS